MGTISLFLFGCAVGFTLSTVNDAWGVKWALMVLQLD